jgi:hypothetical protein
MPDAISLKLSGAELELVSLISLSVSRNIENHR